MQTNIHFLWLKVRATAKYKFRKKLKGGTKSDGMVDSRNLLAAQAEEAKQTIQMARTYHP